jgi:hypothetical protein
LALRSRTHTKLGYASFAEYIERLFGYSPRWTAEKLRVAAALETLPTLRRALGAGDIPWSVARELTRVAIPETESNWLDAARDRTARDVERLVAGHRPGALPDEPIDPAARRHTLRFDVSSEVFAAIREAFAKLRRDAGEPLDDDSALLLMARHILEGPKDPGVSSYQMALTMCPACRRGAALGRGERIELTPDAVDAAECDAQTFDAPSHEATALDSHPDHRHERARQTIPPSTRRLVHHRDAGRCRVPGCRHAVYTDVHHIDPRAAGGSNAPENLITLCSAHHRAAHRGELVVQGRASNGLAFSHADGSPYGRRAMSPGATATSAAAFQALRSLGFRESEARQGLARACTHVGGTATVETLVRWALSDLTGPSTARPIAGIGA